MTRCECHETPFVRILEFSEATGVEDFETLARLTGCGRTCTACRADLEEYLEENRPLVPRLAKAS